MTSNITDRLDGFTQSAGVKNPVVAATTANITLSAAQTIDGISIVSGDRVLVKDQTDTTENGIYECATGSWTRAEDFDGAKDVLTGTLIYVTSGTNNGAEFWYVSTSGDPAPGEAMAFTQSPLQNLTVGTIATQDSDSVSITGGSITGITDLVVADGGTGASTFSDEKLLRGQGTAALDATGINVSDSDEIHGFYAKFKDETGTTYTMLEADTGKTLTFTNASAITVTLPDSLSAGWEVECIQGGAGQVTFSAAGGGALLHRQSHTKIAGQHGACRLKITGNSGGSAAQYNLAGDTST